MIPGAPESPDQRRRQRRPGDALPPAEPLEGLSETRFASPQERFPAWPLILETVTGEFVSRGQASGDYDALGEDETFHRMVSELALSQPWGVQPEQLSELVGLLREEFFGFGVLAPYMRIVGLEEILCNRWDEVFVVTEGSTQRVTPSPFPSEKALVDWLTRMFAAQNKELNLANPAEDGQLPDGSRIHADMPPIAVRGYCFAIRKFRARTFTMDDYLTQGAFSEEYLAALQEWIAKGLNIVVSGSTASGKTSLLNSFGALLPPGDRLIVLENVKELQMTTKNTLYLQAAMRGAHEGRSDSRSLTIRDLLRYSLRLRPDRIVVGEVRSHEAFDLLQALNTGHDGSFTTVHAGSAVHAVRRLEALAMGTGELTLDAVQDLIASVIDIVIQIGRMRGSSTRRILETWQVIHPELVAEHHRDAVEALPGLRILGPQMWAVPLFRAPVGGRTLERLNPTVPVIGRGE